MMSQMAPVVPVLAKKQRSCTTLWGHPVFASIKRWEVPMTCQISWKVVNRGLNITLFDNVEFFQMYNNLARLLWVCLAARQHVVVRHVLLVTLVCSDSQLLCAICAAPPR